MSSAVPRPEHNLTQNNPAWLLCTPDVLSSSLSLLACWMLTAASACAAHNWDTVYRGRASHAQHEPLPQCCSHSFLLARWKHDAGGLSVASQAKATPQQVATAAILRTPMLSTKQQPCSPQSNCNWSAHMHRSAGWHGSPRQASRYTGACQDYQCSHCATVAGVTHNRSASC